MIRGNVWQIEKIKDEKYFIKFLKIMKEIFKKYKVNFIFDINNNSDLESPIYSPTDKKIYITTDNAKIYYKQIIYQLSHEMIHQLIYEICDNQDFKNKYLIYSEILCSAFALYVIEYLGWNDYLTNSLNKINQNVHIHAKYGSEIINLFKNLKKDFDSTFKSSLNKAIDEMKEEYNIQNIPWVTNMHIMPKVLIKQFLNNSNEMNEDIRYIGQRFVRMEKKIFDKLDKIYQKVEMHIPAVIRAIENGSTRFSMLNGYKKTKPIKINIAEEYKLWYEDLTLDQKFTAEIMPRYSNSIIVNSIERFASILELTVASLFLRCITTYKNDFDEKNVFKEMTRIHKLIQSMTPIKIYKTSKKYPIDSIWNILSYHHTILETHFTNKNFLHIRLRLTEDIFLETYLHMYWLNAFYESIEYNWNDIYNNKIIEID